MTRKLEDLFELPTDDVIDTSPDISSPSMPPVISSDTLQEIDKIEAALPLVKGLESSDTEMDELATKAISSYHDLMDLGMNVDARYSSEILAVASQMLGHAITAKTAKLNKKLKMVDLQMKKLALDRRTDAQPASVAGTGHVLDRNQLLQTLMGSKDKLTQKE